MFLIKKQNISTDCYKDVVRTYLSYITEKYPNLSETAIAELLRHSVCKSLGLESKGYDKFIESNVDSCVKIIRPIFKKYNVLNQDIGYKRGMLEACMHCIEFARKKVHNG